MQSQFVESGASNSDLSGADSKFTYVSLPGGGDSAMSESHGQSAQLGQLPSGQ